MDQQTRDKLRARWEAELAKAPPELAAKIRSAPPLTEKQIEIIRRTLYPGNVG